jgi:GDPmannose 4,6-dehydratase
MKAIIFGVTGQDGSHLADLLLEKKYTVIGVSRRCSVDNTGRIKHLLNSDRFNLVHGDITDVFSVMNILRDSEDVDEIYNLAAQSHVQVSFSQPALTWDITGKGCLNILQSIVDLKLHSRFYQASSSEMFGKNYDVDRSQNKFQDENTKFLPQSPYAIAKCAAHYMTRLFREAYGVHASAGILFNHEGPRRGKTFVTRKITHWMGEYSKWLKFNGIKHKDISNKCKNGDDIYASGLAGSFPKLRLGNLEAFRDWGYAGDYVEAMRMMLQQDNPDDYVICTGETHTIREFLDVAFSHIGIFDWTNFVVIDPEFYRPAEVDYLKGDATKANTVLNWKPQTSFSKLIKMMVDSDVGNENI